MLSERNPILFSFFSSFLSFPLSFLFLFPSIPFDASPTRFFLSFLSYKFFISFFESNSFPLHFSSYSFPFVWFIIIFFLSLSLSLSLISLFFISFQLFLFFLFSSLALSVFFLSSFRLIFISSISRPFLSSFFFLFFFHPSFSSFSFILLLLLFLSSFFSYFFFPSSHKYNVHLIFFCATQFPFFHHRRSSIHPFLGSISSSFFYTSTFSDLSFSSQYFFYSGNQTSIFFSLLYFFPYTIFSPLNSSEESSEPSLYESSPGYFENVHQDILRMFTRIFWECSPGYFENVLLARMMSWQLFGSGQKRKETKLSKNSIHPALLSSLFLFSLSLSLSLLRKFCLILSFLYNRSSIRTFLPFLIIYCIEDVSFSQTHSYYMQLLFPFFSFTPSFTSFF